MYGRNKDHPSEGKKKKGKHGRIVSDRHRHPLVKIKGKKTHLVPKMDFCGSMQGKGKLG
jgi:hypothetical protein